MTPNDFPFGQLLGDWQQTKPNQWVRCCPAHDDQKPSLQASISDDRSKLLIHCISNECPTPDILNSVGAKYSDLYLSPPDQHHKQNGKPGGKPRPKIIKTYDYRDEKNILLYQVCRTEPKSFKQRRPNPEKPKSYVYDMKGVRKVLYQLPDLIAAPIKQPVIIVAGEKDADTLRAWGFTATTNSGGEGKWLTAYNQYFRDRRVLIIPDNDEPGQKHARHIAGQLAPLAHSLRIINLPDLPPKGDVTDWAALSSTNDAEALKSIVLSTPDWTPLESITQTDADHPDNLKPNEADEDPHRLARLFLDTRYSHPDGYTLRPYQDSFYRWTGHNYEEIQSAKELRSEVSRFIKAEYDQIHLKQLANPSLAFIPQVKKVTASLVSNVIEAITAYTYLPGKHQPPFWIDSRYTPKQSRGFIPLQNGILPLSLMISDQETNHPIIPHTPLFFSPVILPYTYDESATCPTWDKFLQHNLAGDQQTIDFLQEWFGYNLTPDSKLQKFTVLEGEGANGKSVICSALRAVLGEQNVTAVPLESFGIRFQLTSTLGKLANITGDVGELDKAAEGILKAFTSGDPMQFERKNVQSQITAEPTARLTMAMNNRPRFSDKSDGMWRRMILIPMRVQIKQHERIHGMDKPDFWHDNGELPGIFMWALRGLSSLLKRGEFIEPDISLAAKGDYRDEMNPVRVWLRETFEVSRGAVIETSRVYSCYRQWCEDNGQRPMNSSTLGKEVSRQFPTTTKARGGSRDDRTNVYKHLSFQPGSENLDSEHSPDSSRDWGLF